MATHCAKAVHELRGDWVAEFDFAIQRLFPKVANKFYQALKFWRGAQQVEISFLLDPAVFHLSITSIEGRQKTLKPEEGEKEDRGRAASPHLNVMAKESGSPSLSLMRKAPSLGILIR